VTTPFYSETLLWFNRVNNTDIGLSSEQIAFNDIPDLKQYIYVSKCLGNNPSQDEFQSRV